MQCNYVSKQKQVHFKINVFLMGSTFWYRGLFLRQNSLFIYKNITNFTQCLIVGEYL